MGAPPYGTAAGRCKDMTRIQTSLSTHCFVRVTVSWPSNLERGGKCRRSPNIHQLRVRGEYTWYVKCSSYQ